MADFVLQPCRIRDKRIIPTKDDPVQWDWKQLRENLAPTDSPKARMVLKLISRQGYVLLVQPHPKGPITNIFLQNPDRSNKIDWLLRRQPTFPRRVVSVWRVERADHGASIEEMKPDHPFPPLPVEFPGHGSI
jgi:hypothetical protein